MVALAGCGPSEEPVAPSRPERASGRTVDFAWGSVDGSELSSATTRGRPTAILFVTTYDLASQVQAKHLEQALHRHVPRANGGIVVLEQPKYGVMAQAFRDSLGLSSPVAMADPLTLTGGGPFGKIDRVPTLVVLDRHGREVWRKAGLVTPREIEEALAAGSPRGSAPRP